jgi:hypothetical protein
MLLPFAPDGQSVVRNLGGSVPRQLLLHASAILLSLAAAGAGSAGAQGASIRGRVLTPDSSPVVLADVFIVAQRLRVRTDSAGAYALRGLPAGRQVVTIRRLGYGQVSRTVELAADSVHELDAMLEPHAQAMAAARVSARLVTGIEGFYERLVRERGFYVTREDIQTRQPSRLTDMVRGAPGVALLRSSRGGMSIRFPGAAINRRDCKPLLWLDGTRASDLELDDLSPSTIEGVELYQGPAGTPSHFSSGGGTTSCGTIIVWSRLPGS